MNIKLFSVGFIHLALTLLIPSLLFTYYYPWVYNKVNELTERSQMLDDKHDLVNVMFMFIITWIMFILLTVILLAPIIAKMKLKKK
jgi:hypothetical protein